jgi:DNA-binding MarR family transcriptional regulator
VTGNPIGDLDRLVHEPARLAILVTLAIVDEADFVYLQRRTGLTAGNIASHANRLEGAGYVEVDKGMGGPRRRTVYRLTDAGRTALATYRRAIAELLGL